MMISCQLKMAVGTSLLSCWGASMIAWTLCRRCPCYPYRYTHSSWEQHSNYKLKKTKAKSSSLVGIMAASKQSAAWEKDLLRAIRTQSLLSDCSGPCDCGYFNVAVNFLVSSAVCTKSPHCRVLVLRPPSRRHVSVASGLFYFGQAMHTRTLRR